MVKNFDALELQEIINKPEIRVYEIVWNQPKITTKGSTVINLGMYLDIGGVSIDPDHIFKGLVQILVDDKVVCNGYLPLHCQMKRGDYLEHYSAGCNIDHVGFYPGEVEIKVRLLLYNVHPLAYVDLANCPSLEDVDGKSCIVERTVTTLTLLN